MSHKYKQESILSVNTSLSDTYIYASSTIDFFIASILLISSSILSDKYEVMSGKTASAFKSSGKLPYNSLRYPSSHCSLTLHT